MKTRIKKVKTVSNNENTNKTVVQKTKKSNSKTNHLKNISNCFDIKAISEKDASENKVNSKNSKKIHKIDTSSIGYLNTKMESVGYEEEQNTAKKILKNSTNLPRTDENEAKLTKSVSFKDSEHRKSKKFYINNNQIKTQSYSKSLGIKVILEEDASENKVESKKSKKMNKTDTSSASYSNTKMESVRYEEEQNTAETILKNSTNLPNTNDNEAILTKNVKLEMECSSNSNCKHKRKLSKVENVIQDYLKRIKPS